MKSVALATEDELSEAVGKRLLSEASSEVSIGPLLRRGGAGYLRSNMDKWCALAQHQPVVLLTDLDQGRCAARLIQEWSGARERPAELVFRVAVREIEAWLLADHDAMTRLFGGRARFPTNPDIVPHPKQCLLQLAKDARRELRRDLVSSDGAIASQGLGYNVRLCGFVANQWSPLRASKRSHSLHRARQRIAELVGSPDAR